MVRGLGDAADGGLERLFRAVVAGALDGVDVGVAVGVVEDTPERAFRTGSASALDR